MRIAIAVACCSAAALAAGCGGGLKHIQAGGQPTTDARGAVVAAADDYMTTRYEVALESYLKVTIAGNSATVIAQGRPTAQAIETYTISLQRRGQHWVATACSAQSAP